MEGSMVRRTQELLGRVIRKPPLTERLLSKPPFRYLHDVIGEVIRSTGFMKGLYNEAEMKSDNVKDKDSKIAFLQKAIDVVMMVTGESLAVKPGRIVAGHEPERTNEFLQAIAKCCLSKLSSDDAVQKVLAGEKADVKRKTPSSSKSQNKEIKESKGEEQRSPKEGRGLSELKDKNTDQDQIAKEEVKEAESKEKESDKPKENENKQKTLHKDPHKEGERHEKERTKNRMSKPGREAEKNRDKEKGEGEQEKDPERAKGRDRERRHDGGREKDRSKEKDKERGKNREKEHEKDRERGKDRERERRRERGKDAEQAREHGKDKGEKKSTGLEDNIMRKTEERLIKEKAEPDEESESLARLSRQHSTKGARQRGKTGSEGRKEASKSVSSGAFDRTPSILKEEVEPVIGVQEPGESASDAEGDTPSTAAPETMVTVENGELNGEPPPQVNLRRLPRPSSARPAPPRIRRQESAEILQPERNGSARIVSNVIIDKEEEEEEDDQFVVEASSEVPELTEIATEAAVELEGDEKHGGLVKRILETKKDYELSQAPKSAEKEKPLLYESARRKEKDLVAREVDKFRGSIQALCRSALPLGKLMDYIQEDMDAVKNEYQMWKNENKQLAEALQKEQSITDSAVEPLKAKLAELDQLIRDEQDKICAKRAAVLRNDEKIRKMILNINSRK
ncbi:TRAF3-interacting protein 1 isoform X1 [Sphaerodactylus townsendi]|uniref:TRAF3-interacting protein 1 n=1 Tax=Sphaerodactylus townsendi TaxID=933632 RepID=A0ACB8GEN5_9SAUR|nr:TRAF3-interacting protein 1 isoform X1 [Sphaerodactylus townsendi]